MLRQMVAVTDPDERRTSLGAPSAEPSAAESFLREAGLCTQTLEQLDMAVLAVPSILPSGQYEASPAQVRSPRQS